MRIPTTEQLQSDMIRTHTDYINWLSYKVGQLEARVSVLEGNEEGATPLPPLGVPKQVETRSDDDSIAKEDK